MKKLQLTIAFLLLTSLSILAQDRIFTQTYQSSVLNKGQKELEVWTTVNQGKSNYFRELKTRVEYEIGLSNKLQTAFYLNTKQKAYFDDITGEIVMDASEISISNEWKYKFSDAVADLFGFALYGELTLATDETEVEIKAIFDKKIGKTTHAINITFEPEWETTTVNGKLATNSNLNYDFNYAIAYNANKNWNLGAEIINRNVFVDEEKFTHSALFAGPTVSYNTENFWVNVSYAPQIFGLKNPDNKTGLNVDEFTKNSFRVIFSYGF